MKLFILVSCMFLVLLGLSGLVHATEENDNSDIGEPTHDYSDNDGPAHDYSDNDGPAHDYSDNDEPTHGSHRYSLDGTRLDEDSPIEIIMAFLNWKMGYSLYTENAIESMRDNDSETFKKFLDEQQQDPNDFEEFQEKYNEYARYNLDSIPKRTGSNKIKSTLRTIRRGLRTGASAVSKRLPRKGGRLGRAISFVGLSVLAVLQVVIILCSLPLLLIVGDAYLLVKPFGYFSLTSRRIFSHGTSYFIARTMGQLQAFSNQARPIVFPLLGLGMYYAGYKLYVAHFYEKPELEVVPGDTKFEAEGASPMISSGSDLTPEYDTKITHLQSAPSEGSAEAVASELNGSVASMPTVPTTELHTVVSPMEASEMVVTDDAAPTTTTTDAQDSAAASKLASSSKGHTAAPGRSSSSAATTAPITAGAAIGLLAMALIL